MKSNQSASCGRWCQVIAREALTSEVAICCQYIYKLALTSVLVGVALSFETSALFHRLLFRHRGRDCIVKHSILFFSLPAFQAVHSRLYCQTQHHSLFTAYLSSVADGIVLSIAAPVSFHRPIQLSTACRLKEEALTIRVFPESHCLATADQLNSRNLTANKPPTGCCKLSISRRQAGHKPQLQINGLNLFS